MVTNTPVKKTHRLRNFYKKHERIILMSALGGTTTLAVVSTRGVHQMNEFLKEKGLYEEFYHVADPLKDL